MIKRCNKFFAILLMCCLTHLNVFAEEEHAAQQQQQPNQTVQSILDEIKNKTTIRELDTVLDNVNSKLSVDKENFGCAEKNASFDDVKGEILESFGEKPTPPDPKPDTCETKYPNVNSPARRCCDQRGPEAWKNNTCDCGEDLTWDTEEKECNDKLAQKQAAYDEAKANEQSLANRTLTALTTAATGIGGMELARGLAEQSADAAADQDMAAYLATFRCTYGNTVQVKAGPDVIELPGGNDTELMQLRSEYFTLAADLKERKEALGMAPGIESEEILDKSQMGLYDDENTGITSGAYASLYRAKALESEEDQEKIDAERKASKNRVIGGAVAAGVGVVGGMVGNSLINGKLGEKIEELKDKRTSTKENKNLAETLYQGLSLAGANMSGFNKSDLYEIDLSSLKDKITTIDFTNIDLKGQNAKDLLNPTNSDSFVSSFNNLFTN